MNSLLDGDGCFWTRVTNPVDGTSHFPADYLGGETTTNTLSVLNGTKNTQILGYEILVAGAGASTFAFVITSGAAMGGVTFRADSVGPVEFPAPNDGLRLHRPGNANLGIKPTGTGGTLDIIFYWRKLV